MSAVATAPARPLPGPREPVDQPARRAALGVGSSSRAVPVAGVVLLLSGFVLDNPAVVLCALVTAGSSLLSRRLPLDLSLPAAVLGLLTAALLGGVAAAGSGVDLLARPGLLMVVYLAFTALPVVLPRSGERPSTFLPSPYGRMALVAYLPSAAMTVVGLRQAFDERLAASWALMSTDAAQHMTYLRQMQELGALDYGTGGYPRAFHMLAAMVSVPGTDLQVPGAALGYDLRLVAATACLSLAVVLWCVASLGLRVAQVRGHRSFVAVPAAAGGAVALLGLSSYISTFLHLAAGPSLLASVVLWSLPLVALALVDDRRRLLALTLTAAGSVMLLSHLWQALALAPVVALALYAAPLLRSPRRLVRRLVPDRGALLLLLVLVPAAAVVSRLPLQAIQNSGGLRTVAAIPGKAPGAPTALLVLALLIVVVVACWGRRGWARLLLGHALGLVAVTALTLRATGQGLDLTQYYPQKVLWFFAVLLLPVLSVVLTAVLVRLVVRVWSLLGLLGTRARLARAVTVCVVVALLFAFVAPLLVLMQLRVLDVAFQDSDRGVRRLDIARVHAVQHAPALAVPVSLDDRPLPDPSATAIISKLLSMQTQQPLSQGRPDQVCDDVRLVAGDGPAVVVTALERDYLQGLMRRRGCGDVPVVQVPGGGAHPAFLPKQ